MTSNPPKERSSGISKIQFMTRISIMYFVLPLSGWDGLNLVYINWKNKPLYLYLTPWKIVKTKNEA